MTHTELKDSRYYLPNSARTALEATRAYFGDGADITWEIDLRSRVFGMVVREANATEPFALLFTRKELATLSLARDPFEAGWLLIDRRMQELRPAASITPASSTADEAEISAERFKPIVQPGEEDDE